MVQPLTPPTFTKILVIGGGPAGSYAATALARDGFDVTLLERDVFPRYHVGESLLPSSHYFLAFIGAEMLIKNHGFSIKPGGAVKLRQEIREAYINFIESDSENTAWNVVRSQFDELLLRHSSASGVKVFEGVKVTDIKFSGERPVSAIYETEGNEREKIHFEYLVDASGRTGVLSTKYLKNRRFTNTLMNMAFWGYWTGGTRYAQGTDRENAIWIEALTDETGWAWHIPLHDGTTSVGIVISKNGYSEKKALLSDGDNSNTRFYTDQLARAPGLMQLLDKAELTSEIKSAADYSYSAGDYAGPGYRIVGDAGAFIDPLFSTGVHLAFNGGLCAASTIAASIRGDCTEEKAVEFHNTKIRITYTRFLITILAVYKQIRAQRENILADKDEDNFDSVFHLLSPVVQGDLDIDLRLSPQEIEEIFELLERIVSRCPTQPQPTDEVFKHAVLEVTTKKALDFMHEHSHYHKDVIQGYRVNLVRGKLGLQKV